MSRDQEPPQFPVVRAHDQRERHALAPGAEGGPDLYGLEESAGGWYLAGCTTRLFLIPCPACRERAADLLSPGITPPIHSPAAPGLGVTWEP